MSELIQLSYFGVELPKGIADYYTACASGEFGNSSTLCLWASENQNKDFYRLFRGVLRTARFGFGSCTDTNLAACVCH